MPERTVLTIDLECHDATAGTGLTAKGWSDVYGVKEAVVGRNTHAVAVQIIEFGSGLTDLGQRPIIHVHAEHVNATASTHTKSRSFGVPADIRVQPASRPLISAQARYSQSRSRQRQKFATGRFLFHNLASSTA